MGGIVKSAAGMVTSVLGMDNQAQPVAPPPEAPAAAPPASPAAAPAPPPATSVRNTVGADASGMASPRRRISRGARAATVLTANLDDSKLGG